jgi:hypothetical protein
MAVALALALAGAQTLHRMNMIRHSHLNVAAIWSVFDVNLHDPPGKAANQLGR